MNKSQMPLHFFADMESFAGELRNSVVPFAFQDIFLFLVAKLQGCQSGVFRPQPICLYLALTLRLNTALPGNKHLLSAGSGEDISRGLGYLNHVLEGRAFHACEKSGGEGGLNQSQMKMKDQY